MSSADDGKALSPCGVAAAASRGAGSQTTVREFVRTPFAVRRHAVKVWRAVPKDAWTELSGRADTECAVRRERKAILGVALIAGILVVGFSSVGFRVDGAAGNLCYPLLGWAAPVPANSSSANSAPANGFAANAASGPGWHYLPWQSLSLILWTVAPSLLGWAVVRLVWIPTVARRRATRVATINFARHLGSVYFYVYLMIVVGASLMPFLILLSPGGTETFRWCLWCFLFGESFFVPGVMWMRLIVHDSSGRVFGRARYPLALLYLLLFVVVPIVGMVGELD